MLPKSSDSATVRESFQDWSRIKLMLLWTEEIAPISRILWGSAKLLYYRNENEGDFEDFVNTKLISLLKREG